MRRFVFVVLACGLLFSMESRDDCFVRVRCRMGGDMLRQDGKRLVSRYFGWRMIVLDALCYRLADWERDGWGIAEIFVKVGGTVGVRDAREVGYFGVLGVRDLNESVRGTGLISLHSVAVVESIEPEVGFQRIW